MCGFSLLSLCCLCRRWQLHIRCPLSLQLTFARWEKMLEDAEQKGFIFWPFPPSYGLPRKLLQMLLPAWVKIGNLSHELYPERLNYTAVNASLISGRKIRLILRASRLIIDIFIVAVEMSLKCPFHCWWIQFLCTSISHFCFFSKAIEVIFCCLFKNFIYFYFIWKAEREKMDKDLTFTV